MDLADRESPNPTPDRRNMGRLTGPARDDAGRGRLHAHARLKLGEFILFPFVPADVYSMKPYSV